MPLIARPVPSPDELAHRSASTVTSCTSSATAHACANTAAAAAAADADAEASTNVEFNTTAPLLRITGAATVHDSVRPAATDPRTGSDARQRLLHSRFPSLNRIRSRKTANTTPTPTTTKSTTKEHASNQPSVSASSDRSDNSISSPTSPVFSVDSSASTATTDPDGDNHKAFAATESPPSRPSSGHRQKTASLYSTDSAEPLVRLQEKATPKGTPPSGNVDDWSKNSADQPSAAVNMHQTSSRLLRMTDDDRPFTRDEFSQDKKSANMNNQDFKDLFSTLMVSLPLTAHRVRFSKQEHTFTTEEAITNLGSLKFSQSNRMPDPKDPSRIVTTTTTTTFSMAKEMAKSVCNKFLEARLVESCEGKTAFDSRNSVWQLTPKGMRVLTRFCSRNGIHQRHVNEVLDSPRNMLQMVVLERDPDTDQISNDRGTIEIIFRRFAGSEPNVKVSSSASDNESLSEYATGLIGVRVVKSARPDLKDSPYVFTGKAAIDWLMDCCMVVDRRECQSIASLFLAYDLISQLREERNPSESAANRTIVATKNAHYAITERGMRMAGWLRSPSSSVNGDQLGKLSQTAANSRDSNNNRMQIILRDAALRLLFREFLAETHCEENLTFYVEVKIFLSEYAMAKRSNPPRIDLIRENLASAYSLYNAFLAPGSPCELNIDHNLRNALAGRMTRAVGEDAEMMSSLDEVAVLFDQAQTSVFKLMASDSVPKFSRDPKYASTLRDRNLEHLLTTFSGSA